MIAWPASATVIEVGPRDELQSFARWVETDVKVRMIDCLSDAGFPVIEAVSFASPKFIPHLRHAEEVMARVKKRPGTIAQLLDIPLQGNAAVYGSRRMVLEASARPAAMH